MKKYLLPLIGLLFTVSTQAATFTDGKQFISLEKPVATAPAALKFFSFYCPSCYQYDEVFKVTDNVKKVLPADVKLTEYHVDFLGPLGQDMTHAWSVAILLNVQDKVKPLLFDAVQKKQTIKTADDIRNVFINAGVSASDYDAAWNSFAVKSLTAKQQEMAKAVDLKGVPAIFINGKYMINPKGLKSDDLNSFVQNYADTVRFLITKS
ncbi:TPA: thiol:disulfide interchange protein DsbA [Citrobacter werkmanii]|uniref:thiol:disulfide interchange protein DsbA n=1 Tax=Citrobacter TaxID=544 RepID=UPI0010C9F8DB|nr:MULTISPECIES: thiol:disulfide interchange protein DsbA [Citrobacter]MBJ9294482.1 thiol:disulfide interchange protein DsbA [Citrobacter werkmanii]MDO8232804.1 thiol:disulfide interchange protein DsbA [Citrobacter werkmanii]MDU1875700.1 thiol:disulfide interchange protein DsbA [Citrobacter sp.]TKV16319.1 thiol:disulfide interchange protein DsbA [Citrobacter sp. wls615]